MLVPYLGVVLTITLLPGPDMLLVVRNGAVGGRAAAWATGFGCCAGIAVHASAAVLGLSALLTASEAAYAVVRVAGGAYLVWIGVRLLLARGVGITTASASDARRRSLATCFRQGLLSNVLNPKVAVLFVSLIPQFVAAGEPRARTTAVLALVFWLAAVTFWAAFGVAFDSIAGVMRRPTVTRWLDRVAGVVFVGVGLRVATRT